MELTFRIIDICCYMIGTIFVLVYIDLLFSEEKKEEETENFVSI